MNKRIVFLFIIIILVTSTTYARWFQDKEYLETKSVGQVVFSHDLHLEAVGSNCETCHNDIFNIVTSKNPSYTMADMQKGKSCGACHNGKKAFDVKKDCTTCHAGDLKWENADAGETQFSHSAHLGMDFGCDACHPDLFKAKHLGQKMTMDAMNKGEFCGACHDGNTAFSVEDACESCHLM